MMAKPWARLEIGYLNHPKFLALNANAICLWHEGKSYCDAHLTDGLIPRVALKTFRFRGAASITALTTSCGAKPDGSAYASLWEVHLVGYKMHDYLDHNDCRDEVRARMDRADEQREAERQRKAGWRKSKEQKRGTVPVNVPRDNPQDADVAVPLLTETETPTETSTRPSVSIRESTARGVPIQPRMRPDAAWQGPRGLYVLQRQHEQFVASRNGNSAAVLAFYGEIAEAWGYGALKDANIDPNQPKFWNARFAEKWPPAASSTPQARSNEPEWVRKANERKAARAVQS